MGKQALFEKKQQVREGGRGYYLGCRVERSRGVSSGECLFYCQVLSIEKLYFIWRFLEPGNFQVWPLCFWKEICKNILRCSVFERLKRDVKRQYNVLGKQQNFGPHRPKYESQLHLHSAMTVESSINTFVLSVFQLQHECNDMP